MIAAYLGGDIFDVVSNTGNILCSFNADKVRVEDRETAVWMALKLISSRVDEE